MKGKNLEALKTLIVKRVRDFLDAFCYVIPRYLMKLAANFCNCRKLKWKWYRFTAVIMFKTITYWILEQHCLLKAVIIYIIQITISFHFGYRESKLPHITISVTVRTFFVQSNDFLSIGHVLPKNGVQE